MNDVIISKQNALIKLIRSLDQKKYRDKHQCYRVEGIKLVNEAFQSGVPIKWILLREDFDTKDVRFFHENQRTASIEVFDSLSSFANSEGIMAVIAMKPPADALVHNRVLILDRVRDPGNVGTLFRSAEAFGFGSVYLMQESVDIHHIQTVRASMGSIFRVDSKVISHDDIHQMKKDGFEFIVSGLQKSKTIREIDLYEDSKIALVLGSESHGVSEELMNLSDDIVRIPMEGKVESLNVSIAGSILMQAIQEIQAKRV